VSLVAASFGLPFLLKGLELPPEPSQQEEEDLARIAAAEAAIRAIEQAQHHIGEGRGDADLYTDAGVRIMELYRQRINGRSTTGKEAFLTRKIDEIERRLRLTGLRAERTEIYRIAPCSPALRRDLLQVGQRARSAGVALRNAVTHAICIAMASCGSNT